MAGDQLGCRQQRDVGDRVADPAEKRHRPQPQRVAAGVPRGARLAPPHPLLHELRVGEGERRAQPEATVQLVQGGGPEGAVAGRAEGQRAGGADERREPRAHRRLDPIGVAGRRGHVRREGRRRVRAVVFPPAVDAGAEGEPCAAAEGDAVGGEERPGPLAPARAREGGRGARREGDVVAAAPDDAPLDSRHEPVPRPRRSRPLEGEAPGLRGYLLPARQRLARAVGRHGAERLVVGLRAVPRPQRDGARSPVPVGSAARLLEVRVVHLQRRAVLPALAEERGLDEGRGRGRQASADLERAAQVRGPRRDVDGSALVVRHLDVPRGGEGFAGRAGTPRPALPGREHGPDRGLFVSERGVDGHGGLAGAAEGLDDAPERRAAVEVGCPAFQDLDPLDRGTRHAAPVDPAPEGVVQGHAVEEDQRPAGSARPHAAKRRALRCRVGDPAARPPEQAETRDLAQRVVEGQGGARGDVGPAEDDDALGGVAQPRLGPARGDGHLLASRGSQHQGERLGRGGRPPAFDLGEARSGHHEPALARGLEREGAVRGGGQRRSRRSANRHPGPGHGGPARVPHHAPHDDGSFGAPRQRRDEDQHQRAEHRVPQDRLPGATTAALAG